jgi:hypothetical protein
MIHLLPTGLSLRPAEDFWGEVAAGFVMRRVYKIT